MPPEPGRRQSGPELDVQTSPSIPLTLVETKPLEAPPTIQTDDTPGLTRAASRGNPDAFAQIYETWFDRAYAAARRLTGRDEAFCLDVTQDAMVRAAKKIPPLPSEAALAAWLCRVVHRAALDRLREERRRAAREARRVDRSSGAPPDGPTPELDESIAWVRAQLDELEQDDGALLGARYARGKTLDQAGAEIGLSGDAAHGRIRRVLRRLRRALAENEP